MTFLWLVIWLLQGTPTVSFHGNWNNWAIALIVCAALDLIGALKAS